MSAFELRRLQSVDDVASCADAWNDLWSRSAAVLPTNRAEHVIHWHRTFAAEQPFEAWVVEHNGRFIAALPLVGARGPAPMMRQATNVWSPQGDLLLDESAPHEALRLLVEALRRRSRAMYWLDAAPIDSQRWRLFEAVATEAGMAVIVRPRGDVGSVQIDGDWDRYFATRSSNHRKHMRKASARAEAAGGVELRIVQPTASDDVEGLLGACFEIEDRGWKGAAGSSILRSPGMFEFYLSQARLLAAERQLMIVLLEHNGRPVAFEYAFLSKGVYSPLKLAYDETYADWTPGQLLRHRLFKAFFTDSKIQAVDFCGPLTDATAKWSTSTYTIGRMIVAPPTLLHRTLLAAYTHGMPAVRSARKMLRFFTSPHPRAAR